MRHYEGAEFVPRRQADVDLLEIGLRAAAAIRSEERYAGTWLLRVRLDHRTHDTREDAWLPERTA